jgi:hypothetical protein
MTRSNLKKQAGLSAEARAKAERRSGALLKDFS